MTELQLDFRGAAARLDRAVAVACEGIIGSRRWCGWDVARSFHDIDGLGNGKDCCYDRPSIGVTYALHYHGQRTHDALRVITRVLEQNGGRRLRLLDLGCGTGATASAVVLALDARRAAGLEVPDRVDVIGVDQSPFMVEVAEAIGEQLTDTAVRARHVVGDWEHVATDENARTVVFSGYLFDASDRNDARGYSVELGQRFERSMNRHGAAELLLTTVDTKSVALRAVIREISDAQPITGVASAPIAGEPLQDCADLRDRWTASMPEVRANFGKSYIASAPWQSNSEMYVMGISRVAGAAGERLPVTDEADDLNDDQRAAAVPDDKPTFITGPAGSGKTLVLAERIVRTIVDTRRDDRQVFLVTAFNLVARDAPRARR